jgi:hypothetical protein
VSDSQDYRDGGRSHELAVARSRRRPAFRSAGLGAGGGTRRSAVSIGSMPLETGIAPAATSRDRVHGTRAVAVDRRVDQAERGFA